MKKEKVLTVKKESKNINQFPSTLHQCPKCNKTILKTHIVGYNGAKDNYCSNCGQELDWNNIKIDVIGWIES